METSGWYVLLVKGPRGRRWYRADSFSSTDRAAVELAVRDALTDYGPATPHRLGFRVGTGTDLHVPLAPSHYRPWDTTPDEPADTDLDHLHDDDL